MKYAKELSFIKEQIRRAYDKYGKAERNVTQKRAFDLVTDLDLSIERELSAAIQREFPDDVVLGEEFSSTAEITGRTWTLDPIDGTINMANGNKLFGVQAALIDGGEAVLGIVYLPHLEEWISAVKGEGAECNGTPISVNGDVALQNVLVSLGDYPHRNVEQARMAHDAVRLMIPKIGKFRMWGGACMDFAFLAQGRTHGTVVITKNLWDLLPGLVIAREAGAVVSNLKGLPYQFGDDGIIAAANEEIFSLLRESFSRSLRLEIGGKTYEFDGCIFDFDGTLLDTEKYHYQGWREGYLSLGVHLSEEEYLPLRSTGRLHILSIAEQRLGRKLTSEEVAKACALKDSVYVECCKKLSEKDFIGGAKEFLQALQGKIIKTAVASSSRAAARYSKQFALDGYFDAFLDGNMPFPKKPNPDIFLAAAKALGVEPAKCLVFEDSEAGIQAAVNAGMQVIAVGGIFSEKALLCSQDYHAVLQGIR